MIEEKEPVDIFEDVETIKKESQENKILQKMYDSTPIYVPKKGQVVSGIYEGISSEQYIFSFFGFKDDIRIDVKPNETKYIENLEIGENIDILIDEVITRPNYFIKGSISSLYESKARREIKTLPDDESVIAKVISLNPAGYDMEIIQYGIVLPAFMPNTLAGINKLHDPSSIIGESLEVMVESYSQSEGTYIVSRKKYLQSLIPEAIDNIDFDESYSGIVTGTTSFGVFIEFNECLTGMIHKANLREDWQDRIDEIKPGFEIEFYVKDIIKQKGKRFKIILTQIIRETLWDNIEPGQIIEGIVKSVKRFGTLVNLDEETVGLIHTSEMERKGKSFEKGDTVKCKVISEDRNARKIFLTPV